MTLSEGLLAYAESLEVEAATLRAEAAAMLLETAACAATRRGRAEAMQATVEKLREFVGDDPHCGKVLDESVRSALHRRPPFS